MIKHHVLVALFDALCPFDHGTRIATQTLAKPERHRQREQHTKAAEKGDLDDHCAIHQTLKLESCERQRHRQTRRKRKQNVAFHHPPIDLLKVFVHVLIAHHALPRHVFEHHVFPLREQTAADDPIADEQLHVA